MTSFSKLNLMNTSIGDISVSDLEKTPRSDDIALAMEELSGSTFEENKALENIGNRLDVLIKQAMPSFRNGVDLDSQQTDLGDCTDEFLTLMETSTRSLVQNNHATSPRRGSVSKQLSASSYQAIKDEMNQTFKKEMEFLSQEGDEKCESEESSTSKSRSHLAGSVSLMTGNLDDIDGQEEIVDEDLRNALLQMATESIRTSMGKLDINLESSA